MLKCNAFTVDFLKTFTLHFWSLKLACTAESFFLNIFSLFCHLSPWGSETVWALLVFSLYPIPVLIHCMPSKQKFVPVHLMSLPVRD